MSILSWFKSHASAILLTAIAVAKAGVLGKVAVVVATAISGVVSGSA